MPSVITGGHKCRLIFALLTAAITVHFPQTVSFNKRSTLTCKLLLNPTQFLSLTSVLKKFITGFSSGLSSSWFSSGGLCSLSVSGAFSCSGAGSGVTFSGSVNMDSCFRLAVSYAPSQRISLLRIMLEQRR